MKEKVCTVVMSIRFAFLENKDIPFQTINDQFFRCFQCHSLYCSCFGDDSGELSVVGVNKASAIETLIQHLNIPKEKYFCFWRWNE